MCGRFERALITPLVYAAVGFAEAVWWFERNIYYYLKEVLNGNKAHSEAAKDGPRKC